MLIYIINLPSIAGFSVRASPAGFSGRKLPAARGWRNAVPILGPMVLAGKVGCVDSSGEVDSSFRRGGGLDRLGRVRRLCSRAR